MTSSGRVREADLLLARVRMFGFEVVREGDELVDVRREGRVSTIGLAQVQCTADDPRDAFLLSLALEDELRWSPREFYVAYRPEDGEPVPAQLVLEPGEDPAAPLVLRHSVFGSEGERTPLRSVEDLLDALPFLAPPNAVGYHRARERIIARYEKMRPKTWADVGVTDPGTIAHYERHRVTADDLARAAESGIVGMDAIITAFGIPAEDEWTRVRHERCTVQNAMERETMVLAVVAYIAGLAPLVDLRTLTKGLHGFEFAVIVPQDEKLDVLPRLAELTIDVEDKYGVHFRTLALVGPSRR